MIQLTEKQQKYRAWYQNNKASVCAKKRDNYASSAEQRTEKAAKAKARAANARAAKKAKQQAAPAQALTQVSSQAKKSASHDRARREREFAERLEREALFASIKQSLTPPNQDDLNRLAARRGIEDFCLARQLGLSVEDLQ